jgi:hypothetical protein
VRAILARFFTGRLASALGYLFKVTADLLLRATQSPQPLLNLFDRWGALYRLECLVVLFHVFV